MVQWKYNSEKITRLVKNMRPQAIKSCWSNWGVYLSKTEYSGGSWWLYSSITWKEGLCLPNKTLGFKINPVGKSSRKGEKKTGSSFFDTSGKEKASLESCIVIYSLSVEKIKRPQWPTGWFCKTDSDFKWVGQMTIGIICN